MPVPARSSASESPTWKGRGARSGWGVAFDARPTLVVEMPDHDLRITFFGASEENQLALMAEVARP